MQKMTTPQARIITLPVFAGIACALLGVIVLIGWHTHNLRLLHIYPTFVAMAYNTALCFFVCGLSLLALCFGKPKLALLGGSFSLAIGLLTLGEYLFSANFGIDQALMQAYTRAGIVSYGRMAIATALSFSLSGTALVGLSVGGRFRWRSALIGAIGAWVAGLGIIALSGYITGIGVAYTWGQLTRMAVHTALGFVVLGLGLVITVWQEDRDATGAMPHWMPCLVGIGTATAAVCLWQLLTVQQGAQHALLLRLAASTRLSLEPLFHTQGIVLAGALISGMLLSLLLMGAVALAQTARRQASGLNAAYQELQQMRDDLEARVEERTLELECANKALRDVLISVTEGRFRLCEQENDLPLPFLSLGEPIMLTRSGGLRELRHQALAAAEKCGLPPERQDDLITAVGEAAMNAVVHCGGGIGEVRFTPKGTVQVWIMDEGAGIALENLPRATLERGYSSAGTLGHGFWLILNVIDRLWLLTGATGTTVVLEQDLSSSEPSWLRDDPVLEIQVA